MHDLRGVSIIVAGRDPDRLRTALTLAAAHLALGARARLLLDGVSVSLAAAADPLLDTCLELGAQVTLCQSGLADSGLRADALDPRLHFGGMVAWITELDDNRLLIA